MKAVLKRNTHLSSTLKRVGSAIILTPLCSILLQGCALLGFHDDPYAGDPVARAAHTERHRGPASWQYGAQKPSEDEMSTIAEALENGEIAVGMTPDDVRSVWGSPFSVERAGNPSLGNQRWVYRDTLSYELQPSPSRVVYFERGQVVGWHVNP